MSGISLLLTHTTTEENFGKLGASHNQWGVGLGFFIERGVVVVFVFSFFPPRELPFSQMFEIE